MNAQPQRAHPTRLRSPGRLAGHAVLVALGWLGFVWLWSLVLARPWESRDLRVLVVGTLLVAPALTVLWIAHNVGIYRRRGPRRRLAVVDAPYRRDFHGRAVVADFDALQRQPFVVVAIEGNRKCYRSPASTPTPPAAPPGPRALAHERTTVDG